MSNSKQYCLIQVKSDGHADLVIKAFEKFKNENKLLENKGKILPSENTLNL